jgi:hypothetical protein
MSFIDDREREGERKKKPHYQILKNPPPLCNQYNAFLRLIISFFSTKELVHLAELRLVDTSVGRREALLKGKDQYR